MKPKICEYCGTPNQYRESWPYCKGCGAPTKENADSGLERFEDTIRRVIRFEIGGDTDNIRPGIPYKDFTSSIGHIYVNSGAQPHPITLRNFRLGKG